MNRGRSVLVAAVLLALSFATAYEAAVALGAISLGPVPGAGPAGGEAVLKLGLLALVSGCGLALAESVRPRSSWAAFIGPAAVAFALARFHTYDPYYAPGLRRMSDGGLFSPVWVYGLVASGIASACLARMRPRAGMIATAAVALVAAFTALFSGVGH